MKQALEQTSVGRWQARRLRRATRTDVLAMSVLILLGMAAVIVGRCARASPRPYSSIEIARLLDALELPTRLPDVPLADAQGTPTPLLSRIHTTRAAVAFYAPWCGPCQKELPVLRETLGPDADVLAVVSKDEDLEETRRQLANLGLSDLGFFVDVTGQLHREGRVTGLPTTFLIARSGAVLDRVVGYSRLAVLRLGSKVHPEKDGRSLPHAPEDE